MTPLSTYLHRLFALHSGTWATTERSYYPALAELFNAIGGARSPKVTAIAEVVDRGSGHPDFVLAVETPHDPRAAVEVKGAASLADILRSDRVRRYLTFHDPVLVTNLREFVLARRGPTGHAEEIMRYSLAASEAAFWQTPIDELARQHGEGLTDFLTNVLTWDAMIGRPKDLAEALARYAREALRRLAIQPTASLDPLRNALSKALGLHFTGTQGEHFFRSSLVQTLFYGLFSAWAVWSRANPGADPTGFRWRKAGDYFSLPVLRELFEHIAISSQLEALDVRKPLEWAEATLRRTTWERFAKAFAEGDAVNYFYEPFLEAYDPALREQLGVWYTPREIITYQVARVDRLLRDELGIPAGLADARVVVLDPATGTGGYLLEVLRVINRTLAERGEDALRGMELRNAATTRVFGFEILPAPFIVAHLQIATLLADLDAGLGKHQHAGVYLTNALTGWKLEDGHKQLAFPEYPELKHEAEAAAHVKHDDDAQILVILGNPPYRGQAGVAEDEEHDLIAPYYVGLSERFGVDPRGLNDLYVRFFRLAERQIVEKTRRGIVSFISNSAWLDGLSHPVMREHILSAFDSIWIDNLNGDKFKTGKRTPWGDSDQSIFTTENDPRGIQVGTAIATMVCKSGAQALQVRWRQFWGKADEKRRALLQSLQTGDFDTEFDLLAPAPASRFTLRPSGTQGNYFAWPGLNELFVQQFPGVKTSRDADLIAVDRDQLRWRMQRYFDATISDEAVTLQAPVLMENASGYDAKATRHELLKTSQYSEDHLVRVSYRPLDDRWLYWEGTTRLLDRNRAEFFEQVFPGNLYLESVRRQRKSGIFDHGVVIPYFMDLNFVDGGARCFPLYIRQQGAMFVEQRPNFHTEFLASLAARYGEVENLPELVFFHIAAILNTSAYRTENAGAIEQDWPRIPIPASRALLEASAALGRRVADLLRPDVPFDPPAATRDIATPARIDGGQLTEADLTVTVRYGGIGRYEPPTETSPARLWWSDTAYWQNVPPTVWAFTIGGYPVIKKWLDYRHIEKLKRPLRLEEIRYVAEMARRMATLLALGPALDASYDAVKAATVATQS